MFVKIFEQITIFCAKRVFARSAAHVIGISGSVGKTSARHAIIAALEHSGISCRYSKQKDFNTPLGVAYTILGIETYIHGVSDIPRWVSAIAKSLILGISESHIVIEYGLDVAGDHVNLLNVIQPDIAVITSVAPVHMAGYEQCECPEHTLRTDTVAICEHAKHIVYNADDERILSHLESFSGKKYPIGVGEGVVCRITDSEIAYENTQPIGMRHIVSIAETGKKYDLLRKGVIGKQQGYAAAIAFCVGTICGIDREMCAESVSKQERYPLSRMRILSKRHGYMIDDSYNASPEAVHVFLNTLETVFIHTPDARYYAVLGSMNELGERSERYHKEIANRIKKMKEIYSNVSWLFCGIEAEWYLESGTGKWYKSVFDLIDVEYENIDVCDSVWIKGSQNNVRLDILVAKLLPDDMDPKKFVCRQGKDFEIQKIPVSL